MGSDRLYEAWEEAFTKGQCWAEKVSTERAPTSPPLVAPSAPPPSSGMVPPPSTSPAALPAAPKAPDAAPPIPPGVSRGALPALPLSGVPRSRSTSSIAEQVGAYISIDEQEIRTGDVQGRITASATSMKCKRFLAWCVQSHHTHALPGLLPPQAAREPGRKAKRTRAQGDVHELRKGISEATGRRVTVIGTDDVARLSCPVFLDERS